MSNRFSGYGDFSGYPAIPAIDGMTANHAAQKLPLGTLIKDVLGNEFRYVKFNEAVVKGDVITDIARAVWDTSTVVDGATTATATVIHVDTTTSAWTKNQYAGYWISIATETGLGRAVQIKSHEAVAAAGEVDINLNGVTGEIFGDGDALLIHQPFLVELTDADTEIIRGVAVQTMTSAYFGYMQTKGYVPIVKCGHSTSAAIVADEALTPVAGVPGAVQGLAETEINEIGASPLMACRAVAADTTGFVEAFINA